MVEKGCTHNSKMAPSTHLTPREQTETIAETTGRPCSSLHIRHYGSPYS